jgi:hypothetical protein
VVPLWDAHENTCVQPLNERGGEMGRGLPFGDGLVPRPEASASDRRSPSTAAGEDMLRQAHAWQNAIFQSLTAGWSDEDVQSLLTPHESTRRSTDQTRSSLAARVADTQRSVARSFRRQSAGPRPARNPPSNGAPPHRAVPAVRAPPPSGDAFLSPEPQKRMSTARSRHGVGGRGSNPRPRDYEHSMC